MLFINWKIAISTTIPVLDGIQFSISKTEIEEETRTIYPKQNSWQFEKPVLFQNCSLQF